MDVQCCDFHWHNYIQPGLNGLGLALVRIDWHT
jgi:hypothetical protein